jgi:hypothetical protein
MEEIAVGAPRFQRRLHGRRGDRLIEETQGCLVGFEFARHQTLAYQPA